MRPAVIEPLTDADSLSKSFSLQEVCYFPRSFASSAAGAAAAWRETRGEAAAPRPASQRCARRPHGRSSLTGRYCSRRSGVIEAARQAACGVRSMSRSAAQAAEERARRRGKRGDMRLQ